MFKARAFSCRWRDTISIMLVVSSPRRIIAKITLICFRFTGNKTRMAAVKLIAPTWVSIDIPASLPLTGQWLQRKDIKCTFSLLQNPLSPLCSCLIDDLLRSVQGDRIEIVTNCLRMWLEIGFRLGSRENLFQITRHQCFAAAILNLPLATWI